MNKLKLLPLKIEDKVVALPKIKKNKDRDDLEDIYFANSASKYAVKTEQPKSPSTPTRGNKKSLNPPLPASKKGKEDVKLPPA
jgi:hypothetical protein